MGLESYHIEENGFKRASNMKEISRLTQGRVGERTNQIAPLMEVVRPWNPGFHLGCQIKCILRPQKDSLEMYDDGRLTFIGLGDDKLDGNPNYGVSTLCVKVLFEPEEKYGRDKYFHPRIRHSTWSMPSDLQGLPLLHFDELRNKKYDEIDDLMSVLSGWYEEFFDNKYQRMNYIGQMKRYDLDFEDIILRRVNTDSYKKSRGDYRKKIAERRLDEYKEMVDSESIIHVEGIYSSSSSGPEGSLAGMFTAISGHARSNFNCIHADVLNQCDDFNKAISKLSPMPYRWNDKENKVDYIHPSDEKVKQA
ncbi:hypothetical protein ACFL1H_06585 [Nanoarchaeota archaeon]